MISEERALELPPFPPSRALGPARLTGWLVSDLARSVGRLAFRNRPRDREQVKADYDSGAWKARLDAAEWQVASSLEVYLTNLAPPQMNVHLDGRPRVVAGPDYYRWRIAALQAIVAGVGDGHDSLVELGCGFGANLFSLALSGSWTELVGLDISPNAVETGTRLADHFNMDSVRFGHIDLTEPGHPGFEAIAGKLVLTYLSLEQLPSNLDDALGAIRAAGPARVVHVESAFELLRWGPLDVANRLYVRSMDYQRTLLQRLRAMQQTGMIEIERCERLPFAPTLHNDMSLVVWRPRS